MFGASGAVSSYLLSMWHYYDGDIKSHNRKGAKYSQRVYIARSIAGVLYASLVLSGTFCVIGETRSHHVMYDDIDVEAGNWFIAYTPIDARVATTSEGTHMRPVRSTVIVAGLVHRSRIDAKRP